MYRPATLKTFLGHDLRTGNLIVNSCNLTFYLITNLFLCLPPFIDEKFVPLLIVAIIWTLPTMAFNFIGLDGIASSDLSKMSIWYTYYGVYDAVALLVASGGFLWIMVMKDNLFGASFSLIIIFLLWALHGWNTWLLRSYLETLKSYQSHYAVEKKMLTDSEPTLSISSTQSI